MREANAARSNGAMIQVTILSRQDCHLCEVVLRIARQVQIDVPFVLTRIEIDGDARLIEHYGARVPVVVINGQEIFAGKVTEGDFRRAVEEKTGKKPLKRILDRLRGALRWK